MGFSPTRPPAPKSTSTPSPSSHHRQRRRAAGKKPPTFKLASLEDAMLPPVLRREVLREQMSEYLSTSTNVRREVIIAFIRAVRLASLDVVETHVRWSKQHSRETKFVFKDHGPRGSGEPCQYSITRHHPFIVHLPSPSSFLLFLLLRQILVGWWETLTFSRIILA